MGRKRVFTDAPQDQRCKAAIVLIDKSTAQCGRYKKVGNYCLQHSKILSVPTAQPKRGQGRWPKL